MLQPKVSEAGYVSVSGGLHCPHCDPCLDLERSQGCVERVLVLGNHPVGRLHWGRASLTDQAKGVGRAQVKELVKLMAGGGWVEIGGIQHSVIREVRQG